MAVSYLLLYGIYRIAGFESWWLSMMICIPCGYLLSRAGCPSHVEERTVRKEYILNLQTNQTAGLFLPSEYPGYQKEHTSSDGNDYISKSGSVICTKFVDEKENVEVKSGGIVTHLSCILVGMFVFFFWTAIVSSGQMGYILGSHINILAGNLYSLIWNGAGTLLTKLLVLLREIWMHIADLFSRITGIIGYIRNLI